MRKALRAMWYGLPDPVMGPLHRIADYGAYFGKLVQIAWRPTFVVVKDIRAEFGLIATGLLVAFFLRPRGENDSAFYQVMIGLLWALAAVGVLLAIVFLWNLALAPPRLFFSTRDKLESELHEARLQTEQARLENADKAKREIETFLREHRRLQRTHGSTIIPPAPAEVSMWLNEAVTTLEHHRGHIKNWESQSWRFDAGWQGKWPEHRQRLAGFPEYREALRETERAFQAIALIDKYSAEEHPEQRKLRRAALTQIESALTALDAQLARDAE